MVPVRLQLEPVIFMNIKEYHEYLIEVDLERIRNQLKRFIGDDSLDDYEVNIDKLGLIVGVKKNG